MNSRGLCAADLVTLTEHLLGLDLTDLGRAVLDTPHEATHNGFFERLPGEVLFKILSLLDLQSLCRVAGVCRLLRQASADPQLYTALGLKTCFHLVGDQCLLALENK